MRYSFNFAGGIIKYLEKRIISKFLLFHLLPNKKFPGQPKEAIFFQSLREGHIINTPTNLFCETNDPYFKIFTLIEGFGIQKQFFSFFFKLDIHEKDTKILPIYEGNKTNFFSGKGRFMSNEEIKEILGEESISYRFHKQQMPLPKSLFRRMVIRDLGETSGISPSTSQIRRIRL